MKNIKLFEREINLIVNEDLRMAVKSYLEEAVPNYFWTDGASSSGKYHPQFAQGEGGLVRHTKAVVMFAEELLRMSSYAYMREEYKDYVIAACIVHDTAKYGWTEFDKKEYKNHAANAADAFADWCSLFCDFEPSEFLLNAIRSHMGQWSTEKEDRPFTNIDRCVHMADYMASRSFIDIPQITEEWHEVEMEMVVAGELPF
jgi:HD superfamily phosphohydrolase YqeK